MLNKGTELEGFDYFFPSIFDWTKVISKKTQHPSGPFSYNDFKWITL